MFVHGLLELLGEGNLLVGQLLGQNKVLEDSGAVFFFLWVLLVTAVGLDPLLNPGIALVDLLHQLVILTVLVSDLVLQEADLLRQVLSPHDPFVQDQGRVYGLDGRHPLDDKVDCQIVSRHGC